MMTKKHMVFMIFEDLKKSEVISEIVYKRLKPKASGFEFFMVFLKSTND